MILFLYGPDTYRSSQKLNEIVEYYKKIHKSGLNLKYFEGENLDYRDFRDELQQSSMFREKKLVVLKNIFSNANFKQKFLESGDLLKNAKDIILIYESKPISEKDSLFKFLIKNSKFQEFRLLEGIRLKIWIKREFEKYGVKIEESAIERLIFLVGNDLWRMSEEIKKLVAFKKGKEIKERDVEVLISPKLELDVFKTIDAISLRNKKLAFKFLHSHLKRGEKPAVLFSIIKYQFRNLIQVKDLIEKREKIPQIKSKLDLHPFVLEKILRISQKFKIEELRKIYQRIFNFDLAIKTGKIEPDLALDLFLAQL
jgi:DNA polymerase-3 subunit delta